MFLCNAMVWITAFDQPLSHVARETTFRLLFDIFFSSQSESCLRALRLAIIHSGPGSFRLAVPLFSSASGSRQVHSSWSQSTPNWMTCQSIRHTFTNSVQKNIGPQTSYTVCGSHTQSLNKRSKCGSDNSARKYIAVDQNNERYLFPDVIDINCWPNYSKWPNSLLKKYVQNLGERPDRVFIFITRKSRIGVFTLEGFLGLIRTGRSRSVLQGTKKTERENPTVSRWEERRTHVKKENTC